MQMNGLIYFLICNYALKKYPFFPPPWPRPLEFGQSNRSPAKLFNISHAKKGSPVPENVAFVMPCWIDTGLEARSENTFHRIYILTTEFDQHLQHLGLPLCLSIVNGINDLVRIAQSDTDFD